MCCAVGEIPEIFEEINATYPKYHRECFKRKSQTTGYTGDL
jgi:hypothetical protein